MARAAGVVCIGGLSRTADAVKLIVLRAFCLNLNADIVQPLYLFIIVKIFWKEFEE